VSDVEANFLDGLLDARISLFRSNRFGAGLLDRGRGFSRGIVSLDGDGVVPLRREVDLLPGGAASTGAAAVDSSTTANSGSELTSSAGLASGHGAAA